jgi:cysteinyl-tRNA synthetase
MRADIDAQRERWIAAHPEDTDGTGYLVATLVVIEELRQRFISEGNAPDADRTREMLADTRPDVLVLVRKWFRDRRRFVEADDIRFVLFDLGILVEDGKDGIGTWRRINSGMAVA